MNLPNLKEAKKRDEKEVLYINQQLCVGTWRLPPYMPSECFSSASAASG